MDDMLTIELARRLSDAGLRWEPVSGDRFVVPVSGMEEDVFVISEITVDVHHFATGDVNGRALGRQVATYVYAKANQYINGQTAG